MDDPVGFLNPGPLPLNGGVVEIFAPIGRVGDGLVYSALSEGRPARLREYAPAGIVKRRADAALEPVDPAFAEAWTSACQRFLDQGQKLAALDHYAVATIFRADRRAGEDGADGACTIGAPFGQPLDAALAAGLALSPADVMRLAADIADALATLHARGLTHLDIAPATVSLASGWPELADFAIDNRPFFPLLGSQQGLVRPGYSPIEMSDAAMADPLSPPADIYSASALLFRLITGREPPPWEERWRDPSAAALPPAPGYPEPFLAAIRTGMAIEPADRFRDGAAWRDALGLPRADQQLAQPAGRPLSSRTPPQSQHRPLRPAPVLPPPEPMVPARSWLLPLVLSLAAAVLAVLVYLAITQRWFAKPELIETKPATSTAAPKAPDPLPPPASEVPLLLIGGSASGTLAEGDRVRGSGQFEDRYAFNAFGGERIVIRLTSPQFDPIVSLTGPELSAANDDVEEGNPDAVLTVTLPRAGRYVIAVSSYSRGETGAYTLDIGQQPPEQAAPLDLGSAKRLAGRWRAPEDPQCLAPAINSFEGEALVSRAGSEVYRHRILDSTGSAIITEVVDGPLAGRRFEWEIAPDGASYRIAGETWLRC